MCHYSRKKRLGYLQIVVIFGCNCLNQNAHFPMMLLITCLYTKLIGSRKSLFNVFQEGLCHPKMALVIDDRLKVWDEKDQPRVHVVPAFAPYYSPQAEVCTICIWLCSANAS